MTTANELSKKASLLTEEEDSTDTILPRFLAAGGDQKTFLVVIAKGDRVFRIEDDLHRLEKTIADNELTDVKLVIFDPVIDYTIIVLNKTWTPKCAPF